MTARTHDKARAATPPFELIKSFGPAGMPRWYPSPSCSCQAKAAAGCRKLEQIGIDSVMEKLLDDSRLRSSLRTMDVLDGCINQCDTCLADAPFPAKIINYSSLERLFMDRRFLDLLQPDSLRIGSCGDILDHPRALSILELALQSTESLDRKQLQKNKRHTIKVYVNYRPSREARIDSLLQLLERHQERLAAVISLPLNRSDAANRRFIRYASARDRYFRILETKHADGYPFIVGAIKFRKLRLAVWDVGHPRWLLSVGRVLEPKLLAKRVPFSRRLPLFRALEVEQRGFAKTYLNAAGLWLMVYVTPYESHTSRIFTLLNECNIETLSRVPFHPDFPMPPNWPGGKGVAKRCSREELQAEENEYKKAGNIKKARTIVHD